MIPVIRVFPKIMVPPNHPFVHRVFHYFHHPFWGPTPIFGNSHTVIISNFFQDPMFNIPGQPGPLKMARAEVVFVRGMIFHPGHKLKNLGS